MVMMIDAEQIRSGLPWGGLIDALAAAFANPDSVTVPLRHHHSMAPDRVDGPTLLLMPAWSAAYAGVKIVGVFPANRDKGMPTVSGSYLLLGGEDGQPLALFDGAQLTIRRTAAASVLAATYLARPQSTRLLLVGAGRIASATAHAYSARFPLERIEVWNHRDAGAERLAAQLQTEGLPAVAVSDLGAACGMADLISCATLATEPVVRGEWLGPGTHLDLIGAFTPAMRESDDECVGRATVYVDSFDGALVEGGDIVQPLDSGVLARSDVVGDLFGLASGAVVPGRRDDEITLFKSVGHALEDLVAAVLLYESAVGLHAEERSHR